MIIWLASYPKSGNTWLRSLLSAYFFSKDGEFNFELLKNIDQFPSVKYFKDDLDLYVKPHSTSEKWLIKQAEINKHKKIKLFKTHNALCKIDNNKFTDNKNTLAAIYILRDPRNVISSLANHYQINKEEAFNFMINEKKTIHEKIENRYLGFSPLLSWNQHVDSWIENKIFPVLTIKYEDLQSETFLTLKKVINFLKVISRSKISFNREKAKRSIQSCDFKNLKNLEDKKGFFESMIKKDGSGRVKFFNLGKENDYKKLLDPKQIDSINELFRDKLKKFNYD